MDEVDMTKPARHVYKGSDLQRFLNTSDPTREIVLRFHDYDDAKTVTTFVDRVIVDHGRILIEGHYHDE